MRVLDRTAPHNYWGVVLDAPDARALGDFYARLLGWRVVKNDPDWVTLAPTDGVAYLAVQTAQGYTPPVWPSQPGQQQMMLHLDIEVDDVDAAVEEAIAQGARLADHQPQDDVRVMLDPAGHPFCLYFSD